MATLSFARRKELFNRCDPGESLAPDDERNVDIDAEGDDETRPRGIRWVTDLEEEVMLSNGPVCLFFTGLPGSGKSTELRRLLGCLSDEERAHLFPVLIAAEELIDLSAPIDVPDIIIAVVHGVEMALLKAEGKSTDDASQVSWGRRFWRWLKTTEVDFEQLKFKTPNTEAILSLKSLPSFRDQVRRVVAQHLKAFLKEAHEELGALEARAKALGYEGIVTVFDSLEKLRGTSANWHDVLGAAEQVFCAEGHYLKLPVHVIYTVPPALTARNVEGLRFVPMVKLRTREGARHLQGYNALKKIIQRRFSSDDLKAIFGEQDWHTRVNNLIERSGGYPRDLIRLLQAAVRQSTHPLSSVVFERVCGELTSAYRRQVPESAFEWLAQVHDEKYLTLRDEEHRATADRMNHQIAVLYYRNSSAWHDLHPAVAEIPGVQDAIARRHQASTDPATPES